MRHGAIVLALLVLVSLPASALPTRVFVKSTGMDVGACPITAPCRSFSYALTQVAASGEVIALDTAGYGPFVVTQSVSVFAAPGATAFIAVSGGGFGINIDSPPVSPSDVIVLRGLALTGIGSGVGVGFGAGHSLAIENCVINGFSTGVRMNRGSGDFTRPFMRIDHCTIRNNVGFGISFGDGAGVSIANEAAPVGLTVSNSLFTGNSPFAVEGGNYARVVVTDTTLTGGYTAVGAVADMTGDGAGQIDVERCTISGNTYGVSAGNSGTIPQNPTSIVRIAHNVITGNTFGVNEFGDGLIMTMTSAGTATNTIEANGTDGTFSGTYTAR